MYTLVHHHPATLTSMAFFLPLITIFKNTDLHSHAPHPSVPTPLLQQHAPPPPPPPKRPAYHSIRSVFEFPPSSKTYEQEKMFRSNISQSSVFSFLSFPFLYFLYLFFNDGKLLASLVTKAPAEDASLPLVIHLVRIVIITNKLRITLLLLISSYPSQKIKCDLFVIPRWSRTANSVSRPTTTFIQWYFTSTNLVSPNVLLFFLQTTFEPTDMTVYGFCTLPAKNIEVSMQGYHACAVHSRVQKPLRYCYLKQGPLDDMHWKMAPYFHLLLVKDNLITSQKEIGNGKQPHNIKLTIMNLSNTTTPMEAPLKSTQGSFPCQKIHPSTPLTIGEYNLENKIHKDPATY
ncbi:hypothetical protein VP01_384g2 [Puccinia sorghi]|uniref:Uncharacterized protein n=1 Tax=Puccinia sorghi TaxID=27349 RepID=A0A0L6UT47_9BASI|nr:hypothetical protein VP01_384g2 [Puccinia sorghi]